MRILFVSSNWKVFGAEIVTLHLLKGLKDKGHELRVVTSIWTDGDFSNRLAAMEIPEIQLPLGMLSRRFTWYAMNGTRWTLMHLPVAWRRFNRLLKEFTPDVVVYGSSRLSFFMLPFLGARPSVLVVHENEPPTVQKKFVYRCIVRRLKTVVAVSEFTAGHLRQLGVAEEQTCVIRNACYGLAEIKQLGGANFSDATEVRVGIVGQISTDKGHDVLVEVFALLRARGARVKVKVFGGGDPEYINQLNESLREKGLADGWQWCGYERNPEKIYGAIDICVMPSQLQESFGMVAAEAAAHGLPVIASRLGALPEVVEDGVTGFLVEAGSAVKLADKIEWLAADPQRAKTMGAAGRERVEKLFAVERMVAKFERLFGEITGKQC